MLFNTPGNGKRPNHESPRREVSLPEEAISPRLELGRIVATPGALEALGDANVSPLSLLRRHVLGDWGDLDDEDQATNDRALLEGTQLLSAYTLPKTNARIWIITEWDRSITTLLLPSEY